MKLTSYDIDRLFGIVKVLEHSTQVLRSSVGELCGPTPPRAARSDEPL